MPETIHGTLHHEASLISLKPNQLCNYHLAVYGPPSEPEFTLSTLCNSTHAISTSQGQVQWLPRL